METAYPQAGGIKKYKLFDEAKRNGQTLTRADVENKIAEMMEKYGIKELPIDGFHEYPNPSSGFASLRLLGGIVSAALTALSAYQFGEDVANGKVSDAISSGSATASGALTTASILGGGASSLASLPPIAAALTGLSIGVPIGTWINDHYIDPWLWGPKTGSATTPTTTPAPEQDPPNSTPPCGKSDDGSTSNTNDKPNSTPTIPGPCVEGPGMCNRDLEDNTDPPPDDEDPDNSSQN